jgi:hypothetical protein
MRYLFALAILIIGVTTSAKAQFSGGGDGPVNVTVAAGNAAYARKDYATALAQFAEACDNGSVSACGSLGEMYVKGEGVSANGARAAAPLATACDGGIAAACGKLGILFDTGNGVNVNKARASQLYAQACKNGDKSSCGGAGSTKSQIGWASPPASAVAYFDQLVAEDASGWIMNRYDRGSMSNMKIVSSIEGGRTKIVYGDYTYNGGQSGWVKAKFTDEKLVCLEFWDFSGQCRPLGRSPSQGMAAAFMGAIAVGIMSSGGQQSSSDCNKACRDEREFYQLQKQQRQIETGIVE